MTPMRIGLLSSVGVTLDAFFPEIVREWRNAGHTVALLSGPPAPMGGDVEPTITRNPRPRNVRAPQRLRAWARLHDLDVVLTNTATASMLARVIEMPCPVIYFCHGLHWNSADLRSSHFRLAERIFLRRTQGVIAINSDDEQWFKSHADVPVRRLRAGVGLDLANFPRAPIPDGSLTLCWIGELSHRKRPLDAVAVAAELKRLGVDFQLTIAGDGPLTSEVRRLTRLMDVEDCVQLVGHQPARLVLEASQAVLHTARWEGLPRVLLEAAAVGRPIIAYDVKGVRDVPDAFLSEDGNVAAMSTLVAALVSSGELSTWVPPVAEELSFEKPAAELLDLMWRVIGDRL